jgi:protein-tyrosine phosphatase
MNILFVCSRNQKRSRTAECIFRNRQDINVKSAGFSTKSPVKISEELVLWADLILLMEYKHSKRLNELYRHIHLPVTEVLNIEDRFKFMDKELIDILTEKTEEIINKIKV